jgi:hypothetical protein
MCMSMRSTLSLISLVVVASGSHPAQGANPALDQVQLSDSGSSRLLERRAVAQTFRPALSGLLDRIELHSHILNADVTPFAVSVSIVDTVGGAPSGAALGTIVMDWPSTSGWKAVDFAEESVALQAEHDYGIVIRSTDDLSTFPAYGDEVSVQWNGNPYGRGTYWESEEGGPWEILNPFGPAGDADLAFQTYMVVPEPVSTASIGLPLAFLLVVKRRRAR